jgi:gas vesicle protein
MTDRDEFGAFLVGFVVGGLTGAITALLLAPQSGEETRGVIKERAVDLRGKAATTVGEVYSSAEAAAAEAVKRAEVLLDQAKETAAELQKKGAVVIEEQRSRFTKTGAKDDSMPAAE